MWALVESGTVSKVYNEMPSKITVSNRNYDREIQKEKLWVSCQ